MFGRPNTRLRRFVAIKLPRAEALTAADLRRFLREGQAAAQLRHPRLAAVHQVGRQGKTVFIVADFVDGENLESYLTSHPLSYAEMAELCAEVAEALHHAHELEIVHRDLKPANIIVDRAGKPHVIDFGLAKWSNDGRDLTLQGVVLGTPAYMSPEQADGDAAKQDRRTDVYSLGVILYEMLVGRCPFIGDQGSVIHQILTREPVRLRRINRRIPIDLETIVAKAMEKCAADRYSSALEFANDLRRDLAAEPIKAKRASYAERMFKWSRRHHALVTSFGLAFVLLSAILLASIVMINRARIDTLDALEATSELLYVSDMSAAFDAWDEGYSDEVQSILARYRPTAGTPDRRGFEWHLLDRVARQPEPIVLAGHLGSVNEISVFPDRRRLASVGEDGTLRIWDVATQKSRTITLGHEGLHSVAVSPDGRRVAAGGTTIYLCDSGEAISAREVLRRDDTVESLAFSPDGQKLAAGMRYDELCLLSLEGNVIKSVPCASRVESLEFMPKQPFLLVPNRRAVKYDSRHGIAQLWRDDLSAVEREFDSSYAWRRAEITLARSSPDGKFIAGGGLYQSRVRLFDSATGRVVAESPVARDLLTALAYSPDGKAIAAGYQNGVVECFEVKGLDGKPSISAPQSYRCSSRDRRKFVFCGSQQTCY